MYLCEYIFIKPVFVFSATSLGGQQVTIPDPNDPTKWQIVQTPVPQQAPSESLSPTQVTVSTGSLTPETGASGRRLRRVACTCPNCRDSDGR